MQLDRSADDAPLLMDPIEVCPRRLFAHSVILGIYVRIIIGEMAYTIDLKGSVR